VFWRFYLYFMALTISLDNSSFNCTKLNVARKYRISHQEIQVEVLCIVNSEDDDDDDDEYVTVDTLDKT